RHEIRLSRSLQAVEQNEDRRRLARELANSTLRGMKSKLQCIERQLRADRNRKLAIDGELFHGQRAQGRDDFRKIARERLTGCCAKPGGTAAAKCEAAKAVPLRLELPSLVGRKRIDQLCFHRRRIVRKRRCAGFLRRHESSRRM